ncbi:hypothetical protein [Vibrio sp. SCSIO 43136]|uniref:phage tail tip protein J-related protein n=1 Tax=Vibrio sp. SCSIO 43136 TaxID=2819101 RepID=UPI0020758917|nr:hypothetical protein [Vibrio sp. SCSIO 43136]USD68142.1 hypothetical protein J4N39_18380 [Vibrio sp. SCSIO 43136]
MSKDIIAVGAGIAAGVVAVTVGGVGILGAMWVGGMTGLAASAAMTEHPRPSQAERRQTVRSGNASKQVLVGEGEVGAVWLHCEEQSSNEKNKDGTIKEWLHNAYGLAGHPIYEVTKTFFNERELAKFGTKARVAHHIDPTVTDSYLLANSKSWKADMIGKGTTWSAVSMLFDSDLYPSGIPTPRFRFKGAKDIYDPRTGQRGYTNNAALVILWVLEKDWGITHDRVIWTGWGGITEAANLCDELVTNADGTKEKRYTINGSYLLSEKRGEVLNDLLQTCGGQLVRIGGKVGILPAAYYGPATFTISESDIIGDVQIKPEPERSNAINTVGGSFIDPKQNYVETDFPEVKNDAAIVRDGDVIRTDLKLRFSISPYLSQRLANIQLKRALAGATVQLTMNLKGFYCRLGRVVKLDIPSRGLVGEYRVVDVGRHIQEGVQITLVQEDRNIYDDAVGQEFVPPPIIDIPLGGVAAPTGLQFLAESLGDVVQGTLAWQTQSPKFLNNEIKIEKYIDGGGLELVKVGDSTGNSFSLNGLPVANYKASVRTVALTGRKSLYTAMNFVVDNPRVPDRVGLTTSNWSIHLVPSYDTAVPTGTLFDFFYLADPKSYIKDQPTYDASHINLATQIHTGSDFNHSGLIPDRWQHYWVRGVNIYGKSTFLYVRTGTTKIQDLVTTVVERLEAIEIVSSNYEEGKFGYKLFGPDPNHPQNDGKAEFNDIVARGDMYAKTLTLLDGATVDPAIDNSKVKVTKTYRQDTAPTENLNIGDLWFKTNEGNKPYRWDGTQWALTTITEFDGNINVEDNKGIRKGMKLTNEAVTVYDSLGNVRVKMGKLTP